MSSRSTAWGTKEKRKVLYREASVACPLEWVSEEREEDSMDIHGSASTGTQGAKRRVQKWQTEDIPARLEDHLYQKHI